VKSPSILLCVLLILLVPQFALAFCFVPQPRLVCAEYFASQLVVEGTLVKSQVLRDGKNPEGIIAYIYTVSVNKVYRGKYIDSVRVYDGNDSGRANFDWNQGENYLLFLNNVPYEKAWAADSCGNSGPLNGVSAAMAEVQTIQTARRSGVIQGVASRETISIPFPGAHIEANGNGRSFSATANQNGEFLFNVPSGSYSIRAFAPGFSFQKADISYEAPDKIRIEPGGCAQIQLVGEQNTK
jgi:hypothetical protein